MRTPTIASIATRSDGDGAGALAVARDLPGNFRTKVTLIFPILANIGLHEIDGLSWSLFVWDKVTKHLVSAYRGQLRFDKIQRGSISWEPGFLENLIQKRLEHFSGGAVSKLDQISVEETDTSAIVGQIIRLTGQSPRQ